jgi:hypothetical protein
VTPIGARTATRTAAVRMCPTHHVALDGGPVLYRCETGRHAVYAADLRHEFTPARRAAA